MARNPRQDTPGSWHHVMNRGIARRTLFETAADIRFFLSRLARAVRRGDLEVHAYAILTTHFHLLVRSPRGRLSLAMKVAQNEYVRRFNRARRRDGPLVRGRFCSKPVTTKAYRAVLLRYVDHNPVRAELVDHPCAYPYGSARHYARDGGPPWLERSWVEEHVRTATGRPRFEPTAYLKFASAPLDADNARWIEARLAAKTPSIAAHDPLDDLLSAASPEVLAWMRRKARLADGTAVGLPLVAPSAPLTTVKAWRERHGDWTLPSGRAKIGGWRIAQVALLRDLSASSFGEIGSRLGLSAPHATRLYARHRTLLDDPGYAERLAELTAASLALGHGEAKR
jgi:REP element-mobilizing transposase RayT